MSHQSSKTSNHATLHRRTWTLLHPPHTIRSGERKSWCERRVRYLKTMDSRTIQNNDYGFSLIEMLVVIAILLILAAFSVPTLMNTISDVNLRYSATNLSGLLQTARIQAVRRNTFYGIVPTALANGDTGYFVNLQGGTYVAGNPMVPVGSQIQVFQGIGSGAPNEGAFVAGLGFAVVPGGTVPSFNARGLPCSPTVANTCPQNAGQGFVLFLRRASPRYSLGIAGGKSERPDSDMDLRRQRQLDTALIFK